MVSRKVKSTDRIILLMGPTGAGKSNFIQSLTTKNLEIAKDTLTRGAHQVQVYRLLNHPKYKNRIILVDTPGFIDEFISEYSVLKEIREWMVNNDIPRIDRLLYFDNIDSELTGTRVACFKLFHKICGEKAAHRTCLVTTKWDHVKDISATQKGQSQPLETRANRKWQAILDNHWNDLYTRGSIVFKFVNTRTSAEDALTQVLDSEPDKPAFPLEDLETMLGRTGMGETAFKILLGRRESLMQEAAWMNKEFLDADPKRDERKRSLETIAAEIDEFMSGRLRASYDVTPILGTEIRSTDKVVMLLGRVGSGKSNFIQALTKVKPDIVKPLYISDDRRTNKVEAYRLANHPIWSDSIVLIDTPGFMDWNESDYGVLKDLRTWMQTNNVRHIDRLFFFYRVPPPPHSHTQESLCLELCREICGIDAASKSCLIRTRWGGEGDNGMIQEQTIENLDVLASSYWTEFHKQGSLVLAFHNTSSSAQQLLSHSLASPSDAGYCALENLDIDLTDMQLGKTAYKHLQTQHDFLKLLNNHPEDLKKIVAEMNDFRHSTESRDADESPDDQRMFPVIDREIWQQFLETPVTGSFLQSSDELSEDDILIGVMGNLGAGKTTFISSASGVDLFDDAYHFQTERWPVRCVRIPFPESKYSLVLVDIPGFDDPLRTNREILQDIMDWAKSIYQRRIRVSGFVYLYSIADVRFDAGTAAGLLLFKRLVGESSLYRVVVCSTGWNRVSDSQAARYKEKEMEIMKNHFGSSLRNIAFSERHQFNVATAHSRRTSALNSLASLVLDNTPITLPFQQRRVR
ncbi:hypothetical protein BJ165DRAFT_1499846 [Panaeolus papilionaceus]|nr:hypothetical protein BJ165DRAFT_1499846 [Panaeolus papilionaceus]